MDTLVNDVPKNPIVQKVFRWSGRSILILWAGFWIWFNAVSIPHWYKANGWDEAKIHVYYLLAIFILFSLAWFFELIGSVALIAGATMMFLKFSHMGLIMSLPMVIAALLLIITWVLTYNQKKTETDEAESPSSDG